MWCDLKITLFTSFQIDDDAIFNVRSLDPDSPSGPQPPDPMGGAGQFGADYGDYLKLLEGDSALGFNPQSDPIGDNQVRTISRDTLISSRYRAIMFNYGTVII